jgi:hypothetical protein
MSGARRSGHAWSDPRLVKVLSLAIVAAVTAALLSGFFAHPGALGAHDWDQMESHRLFVVKAIRDFGRFPFWDPYGCGGFPAWGSPESGTVIASPLLPVYLALPLGVAVRVEVVALVVLMVLGCRFFARSYMKDERALALACIVGVLNSRTALQVAVGHTWHLAYAGLPWVLGAFDRALGPVDDAPLSGGRAPINLRWVAVGGIVIMIMIFAGGVYPVPHAALALLGLGAYRAVATKSWRPLAVGAAILAWGVLLASPKVLPMIDTMARFPRFTRSAETVPPRDWLHMFLGSVANAPDRRAEDLDYGWHEYGQYIGVLPLALIVWAIFLKRPSVDPRLRAMRFTGAGLLLLAAGGWGPWVVLHMAPLFHSQRVPTRFTFPAFLLFAVLAGAELEGRWERWSAKVGAARFEALVWGALAISAALVAREDARCTAPWFAVRVPAVAERTGGFAQYADVPPEYAYGDGDSDSPQGTNGAPGLLLRRANVGAIRCSGFAGLNQDAPLGPDGRPLHLGARGLGDPLYRGEAWVDPPGEARVEVTSWAPGEVAVRVSDAAPGSFVVLNQNWDPGWTANGEPTANRADVNAYPAAAGSGEVVFRYRPRTLGWGLALLALGGALVPLALRRGASLPRTWRDPAPADSLGPRTAP